MAKKRIVESQSTNSGILWTNTPKPGDHIFQGHEPEYLAARRRYAEYPGNTGRSGPFSQILVRRDSAASYSYAAIPDRYKGLNESSSVPPRRPTYTTGATGSQLTGTAGKKSTPSRPTLKPTPPSFATLAEQIFSMKSFSKRPTTPSFTHSRVALSGLEKRLTTTVIVGRGPKGDMFNASPPSLPLGRGSQYILGLKDFISKRQKTWKDRNTSSGTRFLQDISAALNPHWSNRYPTTESLKKEFDHNLGKSILSVKAGRRY